MTKFIIPGPDLQIAFFRRLAEIRKSYLLEALLATVRNLRINDIDSQLAELVIQTAQQKVASWGMRGEIIFSVPCVLASNPKLLGYYRMLLGFSQKQFYGDRYGFSRFKPMEESGRMSASNNEQLTALCGALIGSAEKMVVNIESMTRDNIHELTLLTLGTQLRGGVLNLLGSKAVRKIFDLISDLLAPYVVSQSEQTIQIVNAAGRLVRVEFSSDPDICIREELPSGRIRNLVAIEIKGGRDYSNIHNRIGEAEKSHQKAKKEGYVECWTLVGIANLDFDVARKESPTTDKFFHIDLIVSPSSSESADFRENIAARVGIKS